MLLVLVLVLVLVLLLLLLLLSSVYRCLAHVLVGLLLLLLLQDSSVISYRGLAQDSSRSADSALASSHIARSLCSRAVGAHHWRFAHLFALGAIAND